MTDLNTANRDLANGHPLLQQRLPRLVAACLAEGIAVLVTEVWRSNGRQQWLYGAGRTVSMMAIVDAPTTYARPAEARVTDAWSSATSAHGWMENGNPAACAADLVPVGVDGRPWTADDPWDRFVALVEAQSAAIGLRHFRNAHGCITDRPHLELVEYSNELHRLVVASPTQPLAAA